MTTVMAEVFDKGDVDNALAQLLLRPDVSNVHVVPWGRRWVDRIDYILLYKIFWVVTVP